MTTPRPQTPVLSVYNPDLLSKEDLIAGFVARRDLLARLLDDVRREGAAEGAQHTLIIGQRGLGKTTLLRRFAYGVLDDPELAGRWFPLVFPEEQYNVSDLSDFWINCVDALSDSLERCGETAASERVDKRLRGLPRERDRRSAAALDLLTSEADQLQRRLLLLVDNIDAVLSRLDDRQEWELRRILSEQHRLLVVGASTRCPDSACNYGRAFYDFFRIHELRGLDDDETFAVFRELANRSGRDDLLKLLETRSGRIRTLRHLSGGNPRTLMLLFRVLANSTEADIQRDVEQLLDLYTPLYKSRVEELAEQPLKVLDAIAVHWDPLTAGMLAELTLLPVNQVSAQLTRLESEGLIEKVDWFGENKTAFQIAERFFNIWYLMRASRRLRRKLIWFVRFLEAWFGEQEIEARSRELLAKRPDSTRLGALPAKQPGRSAEAGEAYRKAVAADAKEAFLESQPGRYEEVEQAYRTVIEVAPNDAYAWWRLALLLESHSTRYGEAGRAYLQSLGLDPEDSPVFLLRVCERLADSGEDLAVAEELVAGAHQLRPNDPHIALVAAGICMLRDSYRTGAEHFLRAAADESIASPPSLLPFRAAVRMGRIDDVLALMHETGTDQRWRPVYEALQAARAGTPDYLRRIAPEVRTPAAKILKSIAPDLKPKTTKSRKRATPTR